MSEILEKINELYHLSKWSVQKDFIDNLVITDVHEWLFKINSMFNNIPTDRKDKFYYLIDRLSIDISDISLICKLSNINNYIVNRNINNFTSNSLLKYLENNKDMIIKTQYSKFDIEDVKSLLQHKKIQKRDFLSNYVLNALII